MELRGTMLCIVPVLSLVRVHDGIGWENSYFNSVLNDTTFLVHRG